MDVCVCVFACITTMSTDDGSCSKFPDITIEMFFYKKIWLFLMIFFEFSFANKRTRRIDFAVSQTTHRMRFCVFLLNSSLRCESNVFVLSLSLARFAFSFHFTARTTIRQTAQTCTQPDWLNTRLGQSCFVVSLCLCIAYALWCHFIMPNTVQCNTERVN